MCETNLKLQKLKFQKELFGNYQAISKTSSRVAGRETSPEEVVLHLADSEEDSCDTESSNTTKRSKHTPQIQIVKKKRDKSKRSVSWRHSSRSRRLIANARERSRIHIMSEAFDCLRRAVPCYSHDQKLSKLAILRLATSYISALAHLNHLNENDSGKSLKLFADCVEECTRALQTEGRAKKKETPSQQNQQVELDVTDHLN